MKKLIIFILALLLVGAGVWYFFFFKKNPKTEPFIWSATMRPHALSVYSSSGWKKQVALAKELGLTHVRLSWQHDAEPTPFKFHDKVFNEIFNNSMQIYLVIDKEDILDVKDPYMDGYNTGFQIASHYKGKIKYYQLLNEAASTALKNPTMNGESKDNYDQAKYETIREWIKGASEGVKKGDSKAYRVVTDQWTHYAFFEKLAEDKIDYDILGWDWFSDMNLMGDKKVSDGSYLYEKLKAIGKPIMLAEVNQRPDGKDGQKGQDEDAQAEFIQKMADWAKTRPEIIGFSVHELIDVTNSGRGYTDYYGIVAARGTGLKGKIGDKRKAYEVYKELIKKYKN